MSELSYSGSMDDMDVVERQLRLAAHGSAMMGEFVMKDLNGDVIATTPITMDHETIGKVLDSEASSAMAEDLLYKDLDDEQQRIYDELVEAGILPARKP